MAVVFCLTAISIISREVCVANNEVAFVITKATLEEGKGKIVKRMEM
jgi:hypothetical protein